MKYDVFISYSRSDKEVASRICEAFDRAGISYFIDRQGLSGGSYFPQVLAQAIMESQIVLFLASTNSYSSTYVERELNFAVEKKRKVLPYIIDKSILPDHLAFLFSNVNWRFLKDHPIDPYLVNDILELLDRESLPEKYAKPKFNWKLAGLCILGAIIICGITVLALMNCKRGTSSPLTPPRDNKVQLGDRTAYYVDLGLPSGTLWLDRNLGAQAISDFGDYFAWGETQAKEQFSQFGGDAGFQDAAKVYSSGECSIPTMAQAQELLFYCNWNKKQKNGILGWTVTSRINGVSIFLPSAGLKTSSGLEKDTRHGYFWLSDSYMDENGKIWGKELLTADYSHIVFGEIYCGRSIRAVKNSTEARKKAIQTISKCDLPSRPRPVDLSLPNGTIWMDRNVGAPTPFDFGNYIPGNEVSSLSYEYDDTTWVTPTKQQFEELLENCHVNWVEQYEGLNTNGYILTSKANGRTIYFPAAGTKTPDGLSNKNVYCYYWTKTPGPAGMNISMQDTRNDKVPFLGNGPWNNARSVRLVKKQ